MRVLLHSYRMPERGPGFENGSSVEVGGGEKSISILSFLSRPKQQEQYNVSLKQMYTAAWEDSSREWGGRRKTFSTSPIAEII